MKLNPTQVGDVSEAICVAKFLSKGWEVCLPYGHGHAYDIVINRLQGKGLERVQVKTARWDEARGVFVVPLTRSVDGKRGLKDRYDGQVDLIAGCCQRSGKVYLFEFDSCRAKAAITLRVSPCLNGQASGVNMASDFELL